MVNRRVGLADNWLRHVQDVNQKHEKYLGEVLPTRDRSDRLVELNVVEQVVNVAQTTIVQDAWDRGQPLTIHGWVYGLQDGLLRNLGMNVSGPDELSPAFRSLMQTYEGGPG
jgi:carbonic anhydrase